MILSWTDQNLLTIASVLISGASVILPTDTIYGLVGIASNNSTIEGIYKIKGRQPDKPVIILISNLSQLKIFGVTPKPSQKDFLKKYWPGKVSIIMPCQNSRYSYLHRGTYSLAFRYPDNKLLCELINITGPLAAPSANPEGQEPSVNITDAQKYFQNTVSCYVDNKDLVSPASTLVSLMEDKPNVLRGNLV